MEKEKRMPETSGQILVKVFINLIFSILLLIYLIGLSVNMYNTFTIRTQNLELTHREALSDQGVYTLSEGSYRLVFTSQFRLKFKIALNDEFYSQDSLLQPFELQVSGPAVIRVIDAYDVDMYITSDDGGVMSVDYGNLFKVFSIMITVLFYSGANAITIYFWLKLKK